MKRTGQRKSKGIKSEGVPVVEYRMGGKVIE